MIARRTGREVWFDVHVGTEGPAASASVRALPSYIDALGRLADGAKHRVVVFEFNANNHDPTAKTFTFAIYPDGNKTIPARAAAQGMQDGFDLIAALARHPATAHRLSRRLYAYFVSEQILPDDYRDLIDRLDAAFTAARSDLDLVLTESAA